MPSRPEIDDGPVMSIALDRPIRVEDLPDRLTRQLNQANGPPAPAYMPDLDNMRPRKLQHLAAGGESLCEHCKDINVEELLVAGGYGHVESPQDMTSRAQHCPLCERFILRPSGLPYFMEHGRAIGPIYCTLVGTYGAKKLALWTERFTPSSRSRNTDGHLINLKIITDPGKFGLIPYDFQET